MKYTACFEAQVSIRDKPDAAEVKAPRVRRHVAVCRRAELGQTDASYKDFSLLVGGSDDFEWVYIKSLERVHTRNAKHGIVTLTLTNGSTVEVQCERGHAEATRFLSVLKCLKDQKPLVSLDNSSASKFCDECTECSQDGETGKENVNYAEHHTSAGIRTPTHSPDATGTDKKSAAYRHQRDPAATTTTDKVGDRGNKRKYSGSGASESGYTPRRKQQCKPDDAPATQTAATPHAHAEPMDAEHPQENEAATTAPAATRSKTTAPTQAETPRKRWKQHEEVDKVKAQRNDIDEQRKLLERERQEIQQKRETINAEREALNKAIKAKEDEQAKLEKLKKQVDQLGQQYEASVKEKNEEEERLNAATERLRAAKQAYEREEQQHRQQQQQNYQRERQQHAAAGTGGHASEKSAAEREKEERERARKVQEEAARRQQQEARRRAEEEAKRKRREEEERKRNEERQRERNHKQQEEERKQRERSCETKRQHEQRLLQQSKQRSQIVEERFDSLLKQWNRLKNSEEKSLGVSSFPWPDTSTNVALGERVAFITAMDDQSVIKSKVKKALMRWHPDKFSQTFKALLKPSEHDAVFSKVNAAAQLANELRELYL